MSTQPATDRPAAVVARVRELMAAIETMPLTAALDLCGEIDGIVDAARSRRLGDAMAAAADAGQDPLKIGRSAAGRGGRCSRREADRAAKRARAVGANPVLGDGLDAGLLTPGQIDNIAHAMDTDESAASDAELIAEIADRSVDQGRRVANDWITDKTSAKDLGRTHERQRRNRSARKFWSAEHDAMGLTLYGDGPTIDQLWHQINARERIEYANDGGRSVSVLDHPRTRDQRRFDAAVALLLGTAVPGGGRPAAVISIPWTKLAGDADTCCEQIGYGPIPDTTALDALRTSDLFVNITGLRGQTLWWGRTKRRADRNQFISMVVRDKGCVLCGSHWQSTESHHLLPWEAPGKGPTDVDSMALVCSSCHHRLHDNNLTLYSDPTTRQWITRAAMPDEIAPKRPRQRGQPPPLRTPVVAETESAAA